MKQFTTVLSNLQEDLFDYRYAIKDIPKVALWPKILTAQERQAIKDKEEADRRAIEEAEAQAAAEAAAAFAAANKGKQPPPTKAVPSRPISGAVKSEATTRPTTPLAAKQKIEEAALKSLDDEPRDWHFEHYARVVSEMDAANTSVGSILAAMVYQIEKQNEPAKQEQGDRSVIKN